MFYKMTRPSDGLIARQAYLDGVEFGLHQVSRGFCGRVVWGDYVLAVLFLL